MIEKTFQFENEDDVELVERLISKTAPKTVSNILSNPEEWFSKAESLYSVACELEKSYKKKANENNRKEIWRIDFDYAWSVFMVYAFCIENLLKGLIVKKTYR